MGAISDPILERLPAGMRPVRGAVGAVGGLVLISIFYSRWFGTFYAYQAGYPGGDPLLALGVGLVGICAAIWYLIGRPVVFRLQNSAGDRDRSFSPQFSRGMVFAVVGGVLPLFVNGGSSLFMQGLGVFGELLLTVAPLWYWVIGAVEWPYRDWWPDALPTPSGRHAGLVGVAVLVAASAALTMVFALPLVAADETVTRDGVAVTITDVQRTQSVVGPSEVGGRQNETVTAGEDTELLVIEFTAENRAGEPREPLDCGFFCRPTALVSPACGTQLDRHCPEKTPPFTQKFTAGGREYDTYDEWVTLAPGEAHTGTIVYEIPRRSDGGERPKLTFIIYDIGRWDVSGNS